MVRREKKVCHIVCDLNDPFFERVFLKSYKKNARGTKGANHYLGQAEVQLRGGLRRRLGHARGWIFSVHLLRLPNGWGLCLNRMAFQQVASQW